ncbi:MAG: hypothetical protein ABJP82_11840, partial [Hyphomicrobiales bacterium]
EYKVHVPEWLPRWRPWTKARAVLTLSAASQSHKWIASCLGEATSLDIRWSDDRNARYENPDNVYGFTGTRAIAAAVGHVNFAYALLGQAWLLLTVPWAYLFDRALRRET